MDEHTVWLTGEKLEVDRLVSQLSGFEVKSVWRKGDRYSIDAGRERPKHSAGPYQESGLILACQTAQLDKILLTLLAYHVSVGASGIQGIQIHALMERNWQLNGELSSAEIALMAKLGACFTWSMVLEERE